MVKVHLVLASSYQIGMVILSNLVKFGQDAFGSSRLVPKWLRNHVNYVENWSELVKVHLELAGSYQMDMVILMNLAKWPRFIWLEPASAKTTQRIRQNWMEARP